MMRLKRGVGQGRSAALTYSFEDGKLPARIRLHFVNDPVLATA